MKGIWPAISRKFPTIFLKILHSGWISIISCLWYINWYIDYRTLFHKCQAYFPHNCKVYLNFDFRNLFLKKKVPYLQKDFKLLRIRQSASPVVVESDCHSLCISLRGVFVRLRLTLRKPLKRLERNFKLLCSCPQAMPVVVIARGHLIFFSF